MINQLFFGEIISIMEVKDNWSLIRSTLDDYKGWIRNLHFQKIQKKDSILLIQYMVYSKRSALFPSATQKH